MTIKKNLLFIINPHSGNKTAKSIIELVPKYLDEEKFSWSYAYTEYANHATEIAKNAVNDKTDIVIAVGGDGMVNEVFQSLVNTDTAFSIIPKGSGNGVARSYGIPMNAIKAIKNLNDGSFITVDTCLFNERPFLGVAGIGFDGRISALFASKKKRGLKGYIRLILIELFNYSHHRFKITFDNNNVEHIAFIVAFANTQQYGNNAYIAPTAKFDDGKLNIVIINKFSKWLIPILAIRIMTKSILHLKFVNKYETSHITVTTSAKDAHVDGEPITADVINEISIVPKSLKVYL